MNASVNEAQFFTITHNSPASTIARKNHRRMGGVKNLLQLVHNTLVLLAGLLAVNDPLGEIAGDLIAGESFGCGSGITLLLRQIIRV